MVEHFLAVEGGENRGLFQMRFEIFNGIGIKSQGSGGGGFKIGENEGFGKLAWAVDAVVEENDGVIIPDYPVGDNGSRLNEFIGFLAGISCRNGCGGIGGGEVGTFR